MNEPQSNIIIIQLFLDSVGNVVHLRYRFRNAHDDCLRATPPPSKTGPSNLAL